MSIATMNGKDAISGSLGSCYITIGTDRFLFMQALNVEAKMEKTKVEVPIMGRTGKGNKATGWKGTGSAKFHYNTSLFREKLAQYAETGEDFYFDMQLINEDPTSTVGRQSVILKNCNIDGAILSKIDADADYLEDEFDFTFEGFQIAESFKPLAGMR